MDIETLISKAQRGNREAYGTIYKLFFQRIYRYCKVSMNIDSLAEDVCQETFLRAWKSLPSFSIQKNGTFQAFLFRIARNIIIDLSRKKKEFSLEYFDHLETNEDLLANVEKKQQIEKLKKALSNLEEIERQILIFRYFEELSHAEISKILGMKEGALRVRTIRVLHKVRSILKQYE